MLQKWDARVHLTRDLKHLNPHDELYQITWSNTPNNVIFQNWGASFVYPQILKKVSCFEKKEKMEPKVTKMHFD